MSVLRYLFEHVLELSTRLRAITLGVTCHHSSDWSSNNTGTAARGVSAGGWGREVIFLLYRSSIYIKDIVPVRHKFATIPDLLGSTVGSITGRINRDQDSHGVTFRPTLFKTTALLYYFYFVVLYRGRNGLNMCVFSRC